MTATGPRVQLPADGATGARRTEDDCRPGVDDTWQTNRFAYWSSTTRRSTARSWPTCCSRFPGVEVVGRPAMARSRCRKSTQLHPDLVTLDVEMPVMDGLETLRQIQQRELQVGVIMLSALTTQQRQATVTALELGALDFVLKPTSGSSTENTDAAA